MGDAAEVIIFGRRTGTFQTLVHTCVHIDILLLRMRTYCDRDLVHARTCRTVVIDLR